MYTLTLTHNYVQDSLASKVNVDDLASLMPQGGSGGADEAALMSKLIEIQNRLGQLEGERKRACTVHVHM
jgi:hypothetical protein